MDAITTTKNELKPPIGDFLAERVGQIWTDEDACFVLRHIREIDKLACTLVERARRGA